MKFVAEHLVKRTLRTRFTGEEFEYLEIYQRAFTMTDVAQAWLVPDRGRDATMGALEDTGGRRPTWGNDENPLGFFFPFSTFLKINFADSPWIQLSPEHNPPAGLHHARALDSALLLDEKHQLLKVYFCCMTRFDCLISRVLRTSIIIVGVPTKKISMDPTQPTHKHGYYMIFAQLTCNISQKGRNNLHSLPEHDVSQRNFPDLTIRSGLIN